MKKKIIIFVLTIFFLNCSCYAIDTVAVKNIGPGVKYYELATNEPLSIHLLEINLTKKISLDLCIANDGLGIGGECMSKMSKRMLDNGKIVLSGVNGDFFGGDPQQPENSMIIDGIFAKGTNINRSLFAFDFNNEPYIDSLPFNGYFNLNETKIKLSYLNILPIIDESAIINNYFKDDIELRKNQSAIVLIPQDKITINSLNKFKVINVFTKELSNILLLDKYIIITPTYFLDGKNIKKGDIIDVFLGTKPEIKNIKTLIGGLPRIIVDGKAIKSFIGLEGLTSPKFIGKNPRTAIGYNKTKDKIFIIAVDGRNAEHSVGYTLPQLSEYLVSIGCYNALNFDGGGSTTMVLRDSVVNSPTDLTGERKVHNGLFVCYTDSLKDIVSSVNISFDDDEISLTDNDEIKITAWDKWGFKLNVPCELITWTFEGIKGKIKDNYFYPESSGTGTIKWKLGEITGSFNIKVEE